MATIMERALIWADMLFRVISGPRLAISQSLARTCSRLWFSRRSSYDVPAPIGADGMGEVYRAGK